MSDANLDDPSAPQPKPFPLFTVGVTGIVLFVFLALMWIFVQLPNPLAPRAFDAKTEPKQDPPPKIDEVKGRNQAALDGVGAKMPLREAHGKLLGSLKGPNDTLPFPTPEPPAAATPAPDTKKDEGKKP